MKIICIKEAKTKENETIKLLKIDKLTTGNTSDIKKVLFIGVFHGDEPEGYYLINKFTEMILQEKNLNIKNELYFVPNLNPDGKKNNQRTNLNGVDLNRNFPTKNWELSSIKDNYYSGTHPASEIETRFMVEIIDEIKPDIILSIHNPYEIVNFDGPSKELAEKISDITGYPVQDDIGYPTPGSFGTYCGVERNIQTITLELPEKNEIAKLWAINKKVFLLLANI